MTPQISSAQDMGWRPPVDENKVGRSADAGGRGPRLHVAVYPFLKEFIRRAAQPYAAISCVHAPRNEENREPKCLVCS